MHGARKKMKYYALFVWAMVWGVSVHPVWATPRSALDAAADTVMHPQTPGTRALLVMHAGGAPYVRYAPGFGAHNRFLSWSMAKSVTATAIGILVRQGVLTLDAPAPVSAWHTPGDPRAQITLRHLLHMTAGLRHREGVSAKEQTIESADTPRMLFMDGAQDVARYAKAARLDHPPGTVWAYSTATTMIVSDIIANAIAPNAAPIARRRATMDWFQRALFQPLGITTAQWDFDSRGTFLGGSMLTMSLDDWGRLGLLYLNQGRAPNGQALIDPSWIDFVAKPTPGNPEYGAHFWLNAPPLPTHEPVLTYPRGPRDAFGMVGHLGQYMMIIPSKKAVIVRLGKTFDEDMHAVRTALGALVDALPDPAL